MRKLLEHHPETLSRRLVESVQGFDFGDPGRIHTEGMQSRVILEAARSEIAAFLGARSREVVLTSGATESIATAVWGAVTRSVDAGHLPRVVCSAVEHSAVRRAAATFTRHAGGTVIEIGCDRRGRIDTAAMIEAVTPSTALVNIQWGNHEVGTLQEVAPVVAACRELEVLVHVDAAQAVGRVPVDFGSLGADLLSVSGHKFGGPPGCGVRLIRRGLRLAPLLTGGDQERARRAGLEDVMSAVGLAAAMSSLTPDRLAAEERQSRRQVASLVDLATGIDGVTLLGDDDPAGRLPHLCCVAIDGIEPQGVLLGLDQHGIAAHSGSACASEDLEPSPVLAAMGVDAHRSLRLSVGWNTSDADVDAVGRHLPDVIGRLRALTR